MKKFKTASRTTKMRTMALGLNRSERHSVFVVYINVYSILEVLMKLEKQSGGGFQLIMSKSEADKVSDVLLKKAGELNRSTLDLAYLTAEAVLSMENTFRQPKSFYQGASHAG